MSIEILRYFLKLGATGFGGPVALVSAMERDLVERRGWVSPEDFRLGLALSQACPGPLAAQMAMWIGYLQGGAWGALLTALAFITVPFILAVSLAVAYVRYEGLWWIQALFKGINPAVLAIIVLSSWRLMRRTLDSKKLLWAIFLALAIITALVKLEISYAFILSGLLAMFVYAPPRGASRAPLGFLAGFAALPAAAAGEGALSKLFLFFLKSGAFVFGTGLAIVPFMYKGLVETYGWLDQKQFLDAVAVSVITPGPILITVAFIGYLIQGIKGSVLACLGVFLPAYFFTVIPAPFFKRHSQQPQLKAFVEGITAAAIGALAGAAVMLIYQGIRDWPSALIMIAAGIIILRFKLPDVLTVTLAGIMGLLLFK